MGICRVFVSVDNIGIEIATQARDPARFGHARAADARRWPARYYLKGVGATGKFDMRARAAHVASWDRNVGNVLVLP